jgi:hypothetical protein
LNLFERNRFDESRADVIGIAAVHNGDRNHSG